MKLYRVESWGDEHQEFQWFNTPEKAHALVEEHRQDKFVRKSSVDELDIKLTRTGVLAFLNTYAT